MNKLFKRLVQKRGLSREFLMPKYEELADPWELPDMEKAVERIIGAIERGEKILIYGDYDADGVTAAIVMYDALKLAGVKEVGIMLPDRVKDGYGMSKRLVERAEKDGVGLVVTVDCGSRNSEIIEELAERGVDTVVTDHHECGEELPKAVAVVNPKRKDCEVMKELAGVGVAFMVARALQEKGLIPEGQEKWMLDLVCIGTICDQMKIEKENRRLTYWGCKVIERTRRRGLRELMRLARMKPRKVTGEDIGFRIGPRINAAGRMASAEVALKLLMTEDSAEAARLAAELENLNVERKKQQEAAVKEIASGGDFSDDKVIVTTGEWHEGVLGIIAGKLVEKYHKPAFVLARTGTCDGDYIYKGSGRSFGDFSLAEALGVVSEVIIGGGGHKEAAGVKVMGRKLLEFSEGLNKYYGSLGLINQEKYLKCDYDIEAEDFSDLDEELVSEMGELEPFGNGNEEPVFLLRDALVLSTRKMGAEGQHIKWLLRDEKGAKFSVVAFFAKEKWLEVGEGMRRDFLVTVMENEWNGVKSVEGRVKEIRG